MKGGAAIRKSARRQEGQVLPLLVLAMVVLIGFASLVVDVGRFWVAQRQLQTAVDAAALVAGQDLPNASNASTDAVSYSGASGDKNQLSGYGVTASPASVTFECLSHALNYSGCSAAACQQSGATTCNAVTVKETATVTTTFAGIFNIHSFTANASSTAAAHGGGTRPALNVYVILDNTRSMTDACSASVTGINSPDTPDKLDCAKAGMRALLEELDPCSPSLSSCGTASSNGPTQLGANVLDPGDEVGILVFPAINSSAPPQSTLAKEVDCNGKSTFTVTYPAWTPYTYSSSLSDGGIPTSDDYLGYQAVGLSSDYRASDATTTLNWAGVSASDVVEAVDWGQCTGSTYPGPGDIYGLMDVGGQGSYLAGAITEAQHLLNASARPGVPNAIVVLSDGELNDPKTFTDDHPCTDAYDAAQQAIAAGTTIYAIAYDSSTNNDSCGPDTNVPTGETQDPANTHYAADTLMHDIASTSQTVQTFFDETNGDNLAPVFGELADGLSGPRLIPDCTQAPPAC